MKKYMVAAFLAILGAVMIAFPPEAEQTEKIYVPYTVYAGDTLSDICIRLAEKYGDNRLAEKYGDNRDWREIVYYASEQNGKPRYLQPGDKLVIELLVERGRQIENEKSR